MFLILLYHAQNQKSREKHAHKQKYSPFAVIRVDNRTLFGVEYKKEVFFFPITRVIPKKEFAVSFSVPDYMFDSFREVTPAFLKSLQVRCLLCDIDNTLVTYDDAVPTEAVLSWLSAMKENGITVIFLSNNNDDRVKTFTEAIDNAWSADAGKPLTKKAKQLLEKLGFSPEETAVLGDQVFTDVWTGNFLGARATLLVPPIKDKTSLFFRSKRLLEKPFLARYRRREKKKHTK